ncbi:ribonuclease PH, partial [Dietzia sp. Cai40]|nr:ribonuclease PH [Dietzia sp. Cai40]
MTSSTDGRADGRADGDLRDVTITRGFTSHPAG